MFLYSLHQVTSLSSFPDIFLHLSSSLLSYSPLLTPQTIVITFSAGPTHSPLSPQATLVRQIPIQNDKPYEIQDIQSCRSFYKPLRLVFLSYCRLKTSLTSVVELSIAIYCSHQDRAFQVLVPRILPSYSFQLFFGPHGFKHHDQQTGGQ